MSSGKSESALIALNSAPPSACFPLPSSSPGHIGPASCCSFYFNAITCLEPCATRGEMECGGRKGACERSWGLVNSAQSFTKETSASGSKPLCFVQLSSAAWAGRREGDERSAHVCHQGE